MPDVGGNILTGQNYGLVLLAFEHVLSALRLYAAPQLFLSFFGLSCVGANGLAGLASGRIGLALSRQLLPWHGLLLGWCAGLARAR